MNNQTIKSDKGKSKLSLVPTQIMHDIARVREYGIDKYGDPENWKQVEPDRYIDAMLRHALAVGEDKLSVDEESGLPHLWHLACNIAFLSDLLKSELQEIEDPRGYPEELDPAYSFDWRFKNV